MKNLFIILGGAGASIGTYPYAKNFVNQIFYSSQLENLAMIIFVSSAMLANLALSAFSINETLRLYKETSFNRLIMIGSIALTASIATGFLCVMGYTDKLPFHINISISTLVVLVNAAICFSAIHNAFQDISTTEFHVVNDTKKCLIFLTMGVAFITSIVYYLATIDGLITVFNFYNMGNYKNVLASIISAVVWFPTAMLFVNASRITVSNIYDNLRDKNYDFSAARILLTIIAIFSGCSYAEMALEFCDIEKNIPDLFRSFASHKEWVLYLIMPATFIISGMVNAYALNNIFKNFFSKNPADKLREVGA